MRERRVWRINTYLSINNFCLLKLLTFQIFLSLVNGALHRLLTDSRQCSADSLLYWREWVQFNWRTKCNAGLWELFLSTNVVRGMYGSLVCLVPIIIWEGSQYVVESKGHMPHLPSAIFCSGCYHCRCKLEIFETILFFVKVTK